MKGERFLHIAYFYQPIYSQDDKYHRWNVTDEVHHGNEYYVVGGRCILICRGMCF